MKVMPLLLLGTLWSFAVRVWSHDAEATLQQLNHRAFTSVEGAPSDIRALAQTADGTLWIGAGTGLIRFDGVRFVLYPGIGEPPLPSTNISTLLAAPDGSLWIGFLLGGVSVLKAGHVTSYDERDGFPNGSVDQFALDLDGSIWAATRDGLAHFTGQRWMKVGDESQLGIPYGVLVDRTGTLWVASAAGLYARVAGETRFRSIAKLGFIPGRVVLAATPDGTIWAAPDRRLIRIDSPTDPQSGGFVTIRGVSGGPLRFDDAGYLWASDMDANDLLRVPVRELTRTDQREVVVHPETFTHAEGLSAGAVFDVLQDRERNIWVGTSTGLDRFSRTNVVRDAALPCSQAAFAPERAAFVAGEAGALWMACIEGSVPQVVQIRDGAVVTRQITPVFGVAYRDSQGAIWFGGPTALGHVAADGRVATTPLPAPLAGRRVQALVRDRRGALWVSVIGKGLFRSLDGEWPEYGNLDALPRAPAYVATADSTGALWFGYTNNRIARVTDRTVQLFDTRHGLEVGNVMAILAHDGEIFVGGELSFERFDGARFVRIRSAAGGLFRGISGIVRARNGDFWLNGTRGIVHISRQEMERVVRDPSHRVSCEMYDYLDGVPGAAVQFHPQPSAIETTDGRLWFSMTAGMVSIDALHLVRNALPPPVTIWSVTSGRQRYSTLGAGLRLPVHTTHLQIEYSAGSLTVPERVRFRYKLEGSDPDWQEVGSRREARYTNLGPGRYTFRVTAANNDGVWNETGAAFELAIAPAFYQTKWFYALCGLLLAAVLIALYRLRMLQFAAHVRGRLEARLAERERIARELHDTLLQGMQGLIWRFQAATDRIPPGAPARQLMEQSLDRADELLAESRERVKDLRPTAGKMAELAQALATEGDQFAQLHPAKFRVSVAGASRILHPIVREEGLLIAREALSNAFRHARAPDIEAEVTYGETALHVRIRDNGQGIATAVLHAGREGHFGLIGMRERAQKLGAQLEVWSKPGAGTEVDLRVPAAVAYRRLH